MSNFLNVFGLWFLYLYQLTFMWTFLKIFIFIFIWVASFVWPKYFKYISQMYMANLSGWEEIKFEGRNMVEILSDGLNSTWYLSVDGPQRCWRTKKKKWTLARSWVWEENGFQSHQLEVWLLMCKMHLTAGTAGVGLEERVGAGRKY